MALITSFIVTIVCTPAVMALARRTGVLDRPGPLKVHDRPIPYLGGLAILAGLAVGFGSTSPPLLLPLGLALALGVADDVGEVPAVFRVSGEIIVAALVFLIVPPGLIGVLGLLAVVLSFVLLVNAVNLIDGLDALASGVTLVSAIGFALILDGEAQVLALALVGATTGFLLFNRPPARIYLGDGGAYLAGATLAVLLVHAWGEGQSAAVSIGALLMVAVPVAEVAVAVIRRVINHQPLARGDRDHVYDQLVHRGWSRTSATLTLVAVQAFLVLLGLAASMLSTVAALAVVSVSALAVLVMAAMAGFLTPPPAQDVPFPSD